MKRIVESVVASVNASTVFGTKYCNAAPNNKHAAEKYNAFAGTARLFSLPKLLAPDLHEINQTTYDLLRIHHCSWMT